MRNHQLGGNPSSDSDVTYFLTVKPRQPLLRLPTEQEALEAKKAGIDLAAVQVSEVVRGSGLLVKKKLSTMDIDRATLAELRKAGQPQTVEEQVTDYNQRRINRAFGG
jgi:hypothetical protein